MSTFFKYMRRLLFIGILVFILYLFTPVHLDVPLEYQHPSLPNGCEAVSVSMVLKYYGYDISGLEIVERFLDKGPIGSTNPQDAYVGNPAGSGYYAYPKVVAKTANQAISSFQGNKKAKAPLFLDWFRLSWSIHRGNPVIAWVTIDGEWPTKQKEQVWQYDGRRVHPYKNLHVLVVDGVAGWKVHVVDPTHGEKWMPLHEFLALHASLGMKAVIFN